MLYQIRKLVFLSLILFFVGCSTTRSYYEGNYYHHIPHKINNSVAVQRATMKPYSVNGKMYYPTIVQTGNTYRGIASWYGPNFHGKRTSNGEYYDMYAMTAANKTLPMNTIVKVTNLLNGKSAIVRINDRGPFVKNRIIDLSYAAANKLDIISSGTAPVRLKILGFNGKIIASSEKKESVRLSDFSVQIGSFRNPAGSKIYQQRYNNYLNRYKTVIVRGTYENRPIYRVWLSGFKSENEARYFISEGNFRGAFIIRR